MPYEGFAYAFLLGVGLVTAAVIHFFQEKPSNNDHSYEREREEIKENISLRKRFPIICIICQEVIRCNFKELLCGHRFHYRCLNRWAREQRTCPVCRELF